MTKLLPSGLAFRDAAHGIPESEALRPRWCCHCKVVVLGGGVRKSLRDLAFVSKVLGHSFSPVCPEQSCSLVPRAPHGDSMGHVLLGAALVYIQQT